MNLRSEFFRLWYDLDAKYSPSAYFKRLSGQYTQPHRAYHNFDHVRHCLEEFFEVENLTQKPLEVEFALWYHDVFYDPKDVMYRKQQNPNALSDEEKSAKLAQGTAISVGLGEEFAQRVYDLITATKHDGRSQDFDAQILVDADLSILGKSKEEFDEYEKAIGQEYSWVKKKFGDKFYCKKRAEILQHFLSRDSIYTTIFFKDKYEAQAQKNLARSIAFLERGE